MNKIKKSFRNFFNEMRFNTRMRSSFCDEFEKYKSKKLNNKWEKWDMEVCWWACGTVFQKGTWINENDYIIKKINFDSNRSPDYIVENIHNDKTIGIEVTTIQMPTSYSIKNEKHFKGLLKTFNKRINENKTFIDRAIDAYYKKSKNNFINWEKVDKKALVITVESVRTENTLYLIEILRELIKINKINQKFDYFLISSADLFANVIIS